MRQPLTHILLLIGLYAAHNADAVPDYSSDCIGQFDVHHDPEHNDDHLADRTNCYDCIDNIDSYHKLDYDPLSYRSGHRDGAHNADFHHFYDTDAVSNYSSDSDGLCDLGSDAERHDHRFADSIDGKFNPQKSSSGLSTFVFAVESCRCFKMRTAQEECSYRVHRPDHVGITPSQNPMGYLIHVCP